MPQPVILPSATGVTSWPGIPPSPRGVTSQPGILPEHHGVMSQPPSQCWGRDTTAWHGLQCHCSATTYCYPPPSATTVESRPNTPSGATAVKSGLVWGTWTCRRGSVKEATGYFLLVMVGTMRGGCPGRRKGSSTVSLASSGVRQVAAGTRCGGCGAWPARGGPRGVTAGLAPHWIPGQILSLGPYPGSGRR